MLSRQGYKQQWQPSTGLRQSGDIWRTTTRNTGYLHAPYAGPSLQFSLDPDIWATTGVAVVIFAANLIRTQSPWRYRFVFTCDRGSYDGTKWSYTPLDADAGDHALTVQLFDASSGALLGTVSSTVHVTAQTSPARAQPLRIVCAGDSLTAANAYTVQLAVLLNGAGNPAYAMYGTGDGGTAGGHAVRYEGHSGKTWVWYLTDPTSPLVSGGVVNIPNYIATVCGGLSPDLWTIELGINDNFGAIPSSDASIDTFIANMFTSADALISAIQAACPTTDIGILCTTPGNVDEGAFYTNYAGADTSWGWQRIERRLVAQEIAHWSGKQSQKIWLLPANAAMDTVNDYPSNNGVHPLAQGYQKIANTIYGWAKARMAVR